MLSTTNMKRFGKGLVSIVARKWYWLDQCCNHPSWPTAPNPNPLCCAIARVCRHFFNSY